MCSTSSGQDDRQLSDAAVLAKTGKTWPEWFAILDRAGAQLMDHRQIVAYLSRAYVVSPWWQQMVTVTYEQYRVQCLKHADEEEFQVSAAKAFDASPGQVFRAWTDQSLRCQWLTVALDIQRAIPDMSISARWPADSSSFEVEFHMRMDGSCQVEVQHRDLPDIASAENLKAFWTDALERLGVWLDSRP